jgi:hypothetical protein
MEENNEKIQEIKYKYICEKCDYKCRFECEWKKHCETTLHKTGERKKKDNYKENGKCKDCEYTTTNTFLMKKHRLNEHATKEEREKAAAEEAKGVSVDMSNPLQMLKTFANQQKSAFSQEAKAIEDQEKASSQFKMANEAFNNAVA